MTGIKLRAHILAMSSTMEIIIIASVIALVADMGWLAHDIWHNGMNLWYSVVGLGLSSGTFMTIYALRKHHRDTVTNGLKQLKLNKIAEQKQRNRAKRHLQLVRNRKQCEAIK